MSKVLWYDQVAQELNAKSGIILSGNVRDYVTPGTTVKKFLSAILSTREADGPEFTDTGVVIYDRAQGFSFFAPGYDDNRMGPDGNPEAVTRATTDEERLKGLAGANKPDIPPALAALQGGGGNNGDLPKSPSQALELINTAMHKGRNWIVIIDNAELLFPANGTTGQTIEDRTHLAMARSWSTLDVWSKGNSVIMLTDVLSDIHGSLRTPGSRYSTIEIPLPDTDDRTKFITELRPQSSAEWYVSNRQFANLTAGLTLMAIEDILLLAKREGGLTADLINDQKKALVSAEFGGAVTITEPRLSFDDIGGKEILKAKFKAQAELMKEGSRKAWKGCALWGPPGTGKTMLVKALAKESGIPLIEFSPAKMKGSYVGESERNMRRFVEFVRVNTPAIIFIDEVDLMGIGRVSNDSGASQGMMQELMTFMSDEQHRGRLMWIFASNRPDNVDAALKRPGRIDRTFAVLPPDDDERRAIFSIHCAKAGLDVSEAAIEQAVKLSDGWTTEIELSVSMVEEIAMLDDCDHGTALVTSVSETIPAKGDTDMMTDLALAEVRSTRDLPVKYQNRAIAQKEAATETTKVAPRQRTL